MTYLQNLRSSGLANEEKDIKFLSWWLEPNMIPLIEAINLGSHQTKSSGVHGHLR
jgi:hypothetical protein